MTGKRLMTDGNIGRILLEKAIPMTYGMIGVIGLNLIDTFYVGQLGTKYLAAISFTFPIIMMLNAITVGIGNGASAAISRAIGQNDRAKAVRLTSDALVLAFLIVVIISITGILTIDPLFRTMGAKDDLMPLIKEYMTIWYFGSMFVVVPMVGNGAIQATGDMKTPSNIMMVAVVVNIILAPILIYGLFGVPRMELRGAASATVTARTISFFFALWVLTKRDKMTDFRFPGWSASFNSWKTILIVGLPIALTNTVSPLATSVVTRLVSTYGREAVASLGVSIRIESMVLTVMMALGSTMGAFIGQNSGAKKYDRVIIGIKKAHWFSVFYGLFLTLIFGLFGGFFASLFNSDPKVIELSRLYFLIIPLSYGLFNVFMISEVSMNVLRRPLISTLLVLLRTFIVYVPLAHLLSQYFGIGGIFSANAIASISCGTLSIFVVKKVVKRAENNDRHIISTEAV